MRTLVVTIEVEGGEPTKEGMISTSVKGRIDRVTLGALMTSTLVCAIQNMENGAQQGINFAAELRALRKMATEWRTVYAFDVRHLDDPVDGF